MPKACFILLIVCCVVSPACGAFQPLSPPPVVTATPPAPVTRPAPAAVNTPTLEPTMTTQAALSPLSGLQVVYLREGNLWSWTEAEQSVMLTGTGDLDALRLSKDGQVLAFLRGPEVWTVQMDGKQARPIVMLPQAGGALSFSTDGHLLAVSTADHIDVIDLENATANIVLTYPVLPGGYAPEVIWPADSPGFKTLIPPATEIGQAEFLYVFLDGRKASLAKFEMLDLAESPGLISPDGGYVIFVRKLKDGQESLFLMDSSGATRPYGDLAGSVRASAWLPDSRHFVFIYEGESLVFLGDTGGEPPVELDIPAYERIRWVDIDRFLAIKNNNLYVGDINGGEILVAEGVSGFDFAR